MDPSSISADSSIAMLMEKIDEKYEQRNRRICPEESWAKRSVERRKNYELNMECKKIKAILDEPIRAVFILPKGLVSSNDGCPKVIG